MCLLAALFLPVLAARAQGEVVEDVRWEGLRRIPRDTMNARILTKRGDPYDLSILRRDHQAVWNTGFFEDVSLLEEQGEIGKIIVFVVQERPLIRRIEYDGIHSVQQSEILEAFRERRVGLTVEMMYDPTRVRRAEVVLKQLLSLRGRHFAEATHVARRIPPNAVILTFLVKEGPKVKVGEIKFEGNRRFSDRRLVRTMKGSRPIGIPYIWDLMHKTYNGFKVQEDVERVRELYQEHGYFRAVVRPPTTRYRDTQPMLPLKAFPFWFKKGKAVDMLIAVEEGARYRMGKLEVESASGEEKDLIFHPDFLKLLFPLQEGDIFNVTKVRKAFEDYQQLYSNMGYINMSVLPNTDIDDEARIIDVSLNLEPGQMFVVNRIEFLGNTTTRDKVIRRELLLEEGVPFNARAWELSVLRLNQLGYFEELSPENAEQQQNAADGTVDLTLKVKEKGRNSIGLSGGASGVLGSFLGINYSTSNFMGLGETISFSFEFGDRQRSFLFGYTKPYLFDRPLQVGFTFFIREFEFDQARETALTTGRSTFRSAFQSQLLNFVQESTGFTVFASYPLKSRRFTRLGLTYAFDDSSINCSSESCTNLFERLAFRGFAGRDSLEGIRSSRVTPTYIFNTTNHPLFPTRGTSLFVSTTIEGGPLGGNQNSIRPAFELKHFRPLNRGRNTLAMRLLGGFVTGFGDRVPSPFSRFYIGGEDSVRGFDIRAVSPMALVPVRATVPFFFLDPTRLDANGNPSLVQTTVDVLNRTISFPGGDTQLVANFEYRIPLVGPLILAPFLDVGLNTVLRPSQLRLNAQGIEELRQAFPGVEIGDSLSLVPGTNGQVRSSSGLEMVINLPIINAPFRVYWAYNLTRLKESLDLPGSTLQVPEGVTLPPGVFETQILPTLSPVFAGRTVNVNEPLKTFRFTISRTF